MDPVERWTRHLRATGRSPRTVAGYRSDVEQFRSHVDGDLLSTSADDVTAFLDSMTQRGLSSSTVIRRYRSLQQFFGWLHAKHHVPRDPVASVRPPPVDQPVDVVTSRELAALLGACSDVNASRRHGRVGLFESRRDTAVVVLLMTTGMTTSELLGIEVGDVSLDRRTVRVSGRAGRERIVPILPLPTDAMRKYLDAREHHRLAPETGSLWLGERGPTTPSGLRQLLARRCDLAGIRPVTCAHFRRTFAKEAMGRGIPEAELASLGGWGSARSVRRFAPATVSLT